MTDKSEKQIAEEYVREWCKANADKGITSVAGYEHNVEHKVEDAYQEVLKELFLAGYEAARPKWISVKERLPEEGQMVWAYSADHMASYGCMIQYGVWEVVRDGCELTEVLYWQELPKLPDGEAK